MLAPRPRQAARRFDNPQQAADVLIDAAEKFDVANSLTFWAGWRRHRIQRRIRADRQHAANFVAEAHEKKNLSVDPKSGIRVPPRRQ